MNMIFASLVGGGMCADGVENDTTEFEVCMCVLQSSTKCS